MTKDLLNMIRDVEFSNDITSLLHKNETENGLTYFGIYETAHPKWQGWKIVKAYLDLDEYWQQYKITKNDEDLSLSLKKCSKVLSNVTDLNKMVEDFYRTEFFNRMKLDLVQSEHKQIEIMCFAINVGIKPCVKKLQELLNCTVDGIIGTNTINALNAYNESLFNKLFDIKEKEYYDSLSSRLDRYKKGLKNRADKY